MEGLDKLTGLQMLEMGSNRIRVIEGLGALKSLEGLWLGRNRISEISGLAALTNLRRISLQARARWERACQSPQGRARVAG